MCIPYENICFSNELSDSFTNNVGVLLKMLN